MAGLLVVISGPSGVGKTTVVNALKEIYPLGRSVSATSRQPRPGEVDGIDYYFRSESEFLAMVERGEFLETTLSPSGVRYGTLKANVDEILAKGLDVILTIDYIGAFNVRKMMPDRSLLIFINAPMDTITDRLTSRNSESKEDIAIRLKRADEEFSVMDKFDYVVINENGKANIAAEEIKNIIIKERNKK